MHKTAGTLVAPKEVLKKIETLAPEAVNTLEHLMTSSKADSVRLRAAMELLQLAGVTKETRLTIKTDVHAMQDDEIDTRLSDLLHRAQHEVIQGESKDITPKDSA